MFQALHLRFLLLHQYSEVNVNMLVLLRGRKFKNKSTCLSRLGFYANDFHVFEKCSHTGGLFRGTRTLFPEKDVVVLYTLLERIKSIQQ